MSEIQDVTEATSNQSNETEIQNDIQSPERSFIYIWNLNTFLLYVKFSDANIFSPEFEFAGAKWRLQLQAVCKNDKLDTIKIRLVKNEENDSEYYINCEFSLLNATGSSVTRKNISSFMGESVNGHRSSFKCHQKNKNGPSVIIDDKLIVKCELSVISSSSASTVQTSINGSSNQTDNVNGKFDLSSLFINKSKAIKNLLNYHNSLPPFKLMQNQTETIQQPILNDAKFLKDIIIMLILSFVFTLFITNFFNYVYFTVSFESKLNATEINELILDSTLKIRSIAEALNLTDVKIKSSELLAWYDKNYNISESIISN